MAIKIKIKKSSGLFHENKQLTPQIVRRGKINILFGTASTTKF